MTQHARYLQASAAARWMSCPGSVKLCDGLEDEGSAYAEEGTQAHELAAIILEEKRLWSANAYPQDMIEHVLGYVNTVRGYSLGKSTAMMVEQRVDFSEDLGQPDCFGTADCIVLAGDEIQIHDLKYGMGVKVDAVENPQLQLYALGALRAYDMIADFKRARLVIHQVRLNHTSEWVVPIEELRQFGRHARAMAEEALSDQPSFLPSEKACRFCRAKAFCPTLTAHVEETVGAKFDDLDSLSNTDLQDISFAADHMGLNYLAHCMSAVNLVEDWCKGIRSRVEKELLAGNAVDGWKLVQGRKGARKWASEQDAEATLKKMKLKVEDIYDIKLISPTSAEKLHEAGTIGPRQWGQLQQLITQSDGGLSVAPASDPRPAASTVAAADAFDDLT